MGDRWKLNAPQWWTRDGAAEDVWANVEPLAFIAGVDEAQLLDAFDAATLQPSRSGFVWRLDFSGRGAVALKAHSPLRSPAHIAATLRAAEHYAAAGACVAPLSPDPVVGHTAALSLWPWVAHHPDLEGEVAFVAVAQASAVWHQQTAAAVPLPVRQPLNYLAVRLGQLRQAGHTLLADEIAAGEALLHRLDETPSRLGMAVVHGDAHPTNLVGPPSASQLVDVDRVQHAPKAADLLRLAAETAALAAPVAWWEESVALWAYRLGVAVDDVEEDVAAMLPARVATSLASTALIADYEPEVRPQVTRWRQAWTRIRRSGRPQPVRELAGHHR